MDHHPPDSSVYRILQARILKWVAIPSSREIFLLSQGSTFMGKGLDHFQPAHGFINESRLLSTGHSLSPEHGIRPGSDEIGNYQAKGGN